MRSFIRSMSFTLLMPLVILAGCSHTIRKYEERTERPA